jgi:hypothetical protein
MRTQRKTHGRNQKRGEIKINKYNLNKAEFVHLGLLTYMM